MIGIAGKKCLSPRNTEKWKSGKVEKGNWGEEPTLFFSKTLSRSHLWWRGERPASLALAPTPRSRPRTDHTLAPMRRASSRTTVPLTTPPSAVPDNPTNRRALRGHRLYVVAAKSCSVSTWHHQPFIHRDITNPSVRAAPTRSVMRFWLHLVAMHRFHTRSHAQHSLPPSHHRRRTLLLLLPQLLSISSMSAIVT